MKAQAIKQNQTYVSSSKSSINTKIKKSVLKLQTNVT